MKKRIYESKGNSVQRSSPEPDYLLGLSLDGYYTLLIKRGYTEGLAGKIARRLQYEGRKFRPLTKPLP